MTQINHSQQSQVFVPMPIGLRAVGGPAAGGPKSLLLYTEGDPQQLCALIDQLVAALQAIRPQGPPA